MKKEIHGIEFRFILDYLWHYTVYVCPYILFNNMKIPLLGKGYTMSSLNNQDLGIS